MFLIRSASNTLDYHKTKDMFYVPRLDPDSPYDTITRIGDAEYLEGYLVLQKFSTNSYPEKYDGVRVLKVRGGTEYKRQNATVLWFPRKPHPQFIYHSGIYEIVDESDADLEVDILLQCVNRFVRMVHKPCYPLAMLVESVDKSDDTLLMGDDTMVEVAKKLIIR